MMFEIGSSEKLKRSKFPLKGQEIRFKLTYLAFLTDRPYFKSGKLPPLGTKMFTPTRFMPAKKGTKKNHHRLWMFVCIVIDRIYSQLCSHVNY